MAERCVVRPCETAADCGAKAQFTCDDGLCTSFPCAETDECGIGLQCAGGYCLSMGCPDHDGDGVGFGPDCAGSVDCDDDDPLASPEWTEGPAGDPNCMDGSDNDCSGATDGEDTQCASTPCTGSADCDDDLFCNGVEECVEDLCVTGSPPCSDDGLSCTTTCDEDSETCNLRSTGTCLIDGACYDDGDVNPANWCQECHVSSDASEWTADDTNPCSDDVFCNGAELCLAGVCWNAGVSACGDDGLSCTTTCDEDAQLCNALDASNCLIDSVCYADGEANPSNPCQECNAGVATDVWTDDDANSCDDGFFCNGADACQSGTCVNMGPSPCSDSGISCTETCDEGADGCEAVLADFCLIDGTCYANGATNPASSCQECDSLADQGTWTVDDSNGCDDGLFCNGADACQSGSCVNIGPTPCGSSAAPCVASCDDSIDACGVINTGSCLIDATCYADGDVNPANPCQDCKAGVTQTAWTNDDTNSCLDNQFCDGTESCQSGSCVAGDSPCGGDGLSCTLTCSEATSQCNALSPNTCLIGGVCYDDGDPDPSNPCQECASTSDDSDWTLDDTNSCGDSDFCNGVEACSAGSCLASASPCSADGLACTTTCDDATDSCNVLQAGSCLIGAACYDDGDANPANPCQECKTTSAANAWTNDDANSCSDGVSCTTDSCSAGICEAAANDSLCGAGQVCAPGCFGAPTGCGTVPTVALSCPSSAASGSSAATCTLDLGSLTGQASCLSCTSVIGMTLLDQATFSGCSLGKWSVETALPDWPSCPYAGAPWSIKDEDLLFANGQTWALTQTVDTSGFTDVRLCFDYADKSTSGDDFVAVSLGASLLPALFSDFDGPTDDSEEDLVPTCIDLTDLDATAADNPALKINIGLSATGMSDYVMIDNIVIHGWNSAFVSPNNQIFTEDFSTCDLSNWTVNGDAPTCPVSLGGLAGTDALEVTSGSWTIDTFVDTSTLCDDVRVGFAHGTDRADAQERFALEFDAGSGFNGVFRAERTLAGDDSFFLFDCSSEIGCSVSLTDRDRNAAFNSSLGILFELESNNSDRAVMLDDVFVSGATCASGDTTLAIGQISESGGGSYTVDLQSPSQHTAHLSCTWDGRPSTLTRDSVWFTP